MEHALHSHLAIRDSQRRPTGTMGPLTLLLTALFVVGVLCALTVVVRLGIRMGSAGALVSAPAAGLAAFLAGARATDPLLGALAGSALCLLLLVLAYFAFLRPGMTWAERKLGREWSRRAALHSILAAGSLLFLVPFAWLAVTSLKEDEDMSKFPPVWTPRQQVKMKLNGKDAGLASASYQGTPVKVAVLAERETGERELRVLEPASLAGKEFVLPRSEVTKIKQFAPVWANYPNALKFFPPETNQGMVFVWNTVLLSSLTILGTLLSSSMVAFSFARLKWPGRDTAFGIVLATMMLPTAVTMMPTFLVFRQLGWIDSLRPLWVPSFFGVAFHIFLLRQFFLTIPNDLEDAAKIDGCSYWAIYQRVMLPLIKPALAAVTIMVFMAAWNNFMGPLIYVSSPLRMPLAYALQLFQTARGGEPGLLMAAACMMTLPVVLIFFVTQRYFIQGVTLTGIKG